MATKKEIELVRELAKNSGFAKSLLRRHEAGEKLTAAQIHAAKEIHRVYVAEPAAKKAAAAARKAARTAKVAA